MRAAVTTRRVLGAIVVTVLFVSCGARTGLLVPEEPEEPDAPADVRPDVRDAAAEDAPKDVVSDDSLVFPDVPIISDCPDAGETLIYIVGTANELYSFYPPTRAFTQIGTIACETTGTPNSMAVTRSGIAFVNFTDGNLFEVSTANAACKATPYVADQHQYLEYGMGYTAIADGGETLFVAGLGGVFSQGLANIDTTAFTLDLIAPFSPMQYNCELSGTATGELYGFCPFQGGSYLIQIDPVTANVLTSVQLSAGFHGGQEAWAFAYWGGDFWLFTGSSGPSTVTDYDPVAMTETVVAIAPLEIIGAGVSTCAPE